jgi:hypothetical protein
MLGATKNAYVIARDFIVVGRFDPVAPGTILQMPESRAEHYVTAGRADRCTAPPKGARVATYSESDFQPRPVAAPPEPMGREAICTQRGWTDQQWAAAQVCGFPPVTRTLRKIVPNGGLVVEPQWRADHVDAWVERVRSLKLA